MSTVYILEDIFCKLELTSPVSTLDASFLQPVRKESRDLFEELGALESSEEASESSDECRMEIRIERSPSKSVKVPKVDPDNPFLSPVRKVSAFESN